MNLARGTGKREQNPEREPGTRNLDSGTARLRRVIVLTPQAAGADGISTISREVIAALRGALGRGVGALDVWSMTDAAPVADAEGPGVSFRGAGGSRLAFATFGVRDAAVDEGTVVLVLHAHLLPVALPLIGRGARVVAMLLGVEAWKPLTALQRATLRRAWRVAAISQHTIDRFRIANPALARLDVRVCYPGPPGSYSSTNTNGPNDRDDPHVPGDPGDPSDPIDAPPFALIVGRMSSAERYKGHDELLDCWSAVRHAHPAARLVIAGGGDDGPRLREKARGLGLDAHVRFEGVAGPARLADLYRRAAFFVMPSLNEGFGFVYLEAMGAGLPCIAAPGAAEEIIEHGVSGLIADPRQPGVLAAAIARLFASPATREGMGRAAAQRVRKFTGFSDRLLDLLAC